MRKELRKGTTAKVDLQRFFPLDCRLTQSPRSSNRTARGRGRILSQKCQFPSLQKMGDVAYNHLITFGDRRRSCNRRNRGEAVPIQFVAGDLFANAYKAQAFAHGCNCQGSKGAGIALGFRERYPDMYEQFRARCKAEPRQFNLGDAFLWKAQGRPWVFNLGTQERFWRARASYEAIETALKRMRELADAEGVTSIAIPRIGVGYGGLSWKKVRAIVERVFADWPGRLVVYEEFVPSNRKRQAKPAAAPKRDTGRPRRSSSARRDR